jgi:hypothetical protein
MSPTMTPGASSANLLRLIRTYLPTPPAPGGGSESDDIRRQALSDPGYYVRNNEQVWLLTWAVALAGRPDLAHELRAVVLTGTAKTLASLEAIRRQAEADGRGSAFLLEIDSISAALRRKFEYRTSRWQTPDDLEDLAAESLAPSEEEFRGIRDSLPFPQAWLDDDSPRPF